MSNLINQHRDILSLSEVFVSFANAGFVHKQLDGEKFWRLLTDASPVLRKTINPDNSPVEFTYEFTPDSPWTMQTLPACLYMTLPHFSDDPDGLYREMEPLIKARARAALGDHYRFWFDWLTAREGKKLWIERSGNSLTMVKPLLRTFPNAKFVHIHRDGRETALSMANFLPLRFFMKIWARLRWLGVDLLKPPFRYSDSRLIHFFSQLTAEQIPVERLIASPPDVAEAGRFWSAMIAQGLKDLEAVQRDHLHIINYRDLVIKPRETLEKFIEFSAPGLDHQPWLDRVSSIPKDSPPKWLTLSKADQVRLETACKPGMQLLGYV